MSGSGQVDSEDTEAIKAEAETKPIVKEAGANTVKSGEKSRMTELRVRSRVSCHTHGVTGTRP